MINLLRLDRKPFLPEKSFLCAILFGDILLIVFSDIASLSLIFETTLPHTPQPNLLAYFHIFLPIIIIRLMSLYYFGLYNKLKAKTNFEITTGVLKAVSISTLVIIAAAFYLRAFAYPRSVIILSWALTSSVCIIWRVAARAITSALMGKEAVSSRIIIVGIDKDAQRLGLHISKDSAAKYELLGFINPLPGAATEEETSLKILGALDDLPRITEKENVNEVIIATKDIPQGRLIKILTDLHYKRISCKVVPQDYEATIGNIITAPIAGIAPIFIAPLEEKFYWYKGLKRIFDIILSLAVLILASPLMLIINLLIKISSAGPVLYRQERIGLYGKHITIYKFRTMNQDAEKDGPLWASENDPRITPLGGFLRRTRLDELPQLFNVLKNEMSLVGPRPERMYFVEKLKNEIPFYLERLTVKPGVTGWAQINCPYADSIETSKEKFLQDIFYMKNMTLALDILILLKTFWIIIQEKGSR